MGSGGSGLGSTTGFGWSVPSLGHIWTQFDKGRNLGADAEHFRSGYTSASETGPGPFSPATISPKGRAVISSAKADKTLESAFRNSSLIGACRSPTYPTGLEFKRSSMAYLPDRIKTCLRCKPFVPNARIAVFHNRPFGRVNQDALL
jgi:hypothetical protein